MSVQDADVGESSPLVVFAEQAQETSDDRSFVRASICDLIIPLYTPDFMKSLDQTILLPVIPYMIVHDLHYSSFAVGVAVALKGFGEIFAGVTVGSINATIGSKKVLLSCELIRGLAGLFTFLFPYYPVVCLSLLVEGLVSSGWNIGRNSFLSQYTEKSNRGKIVSVMSVSKRSAKTIGPLVGGVIMTYLSSRYGFLLRAAMSFISFFIMALYFPDGGTKDKKARAMGFISVCNIYRKLLWTYGLFIFAMLWARSVRKIILTLALQETPEEVSPASLGYVNSLSFFTDTILAISAGFIMDSYGRKYSAIPGMLLIGLAFFILMIPGQTAVYVSGAIFGIGNGISSGLKKVIGADVAPSDARSEFIGAFETFSNVAKLLGPIVCGYMLEYFSLVANQWVNAIIAISGALWIAFACKEPLSIKNN